MGNNMTDNQQEQAPEEQSHHFDTALSPTLSGTGSNDILFGNIDEETNDNTQATYSPPPSMSTSK